MRDYLAPRSFVDWRDRRPGGSCPSSCSTAIDGRDVPARRLRSFRLWEGDAPAELPVSVSHIVHYGSAGASPSRNRMGQTFLSVSGLQDNQISLLKQVLRGPSHQVRTNILFTHRPKPCYSVFRLGEKRSGSCSTARVVELHVNHGEVVLSVIE